jgi:hypothetical protein
MKPALFIDLTKEEVVKGLGVGETPIIMGGKK